MTTLIEYDHHSAAAVAITKYREEYDSILSPQAKVVLTSPAFSQFVADTQMTVIGGSTHDHLDAASDEAVHWCLGMVEVLANTRPNALHQLLWPTQIGIER